MIENTSKIDIKRSEGYFKSFDQTKLYWQRWGSPQNQNPKTVIFVHGFAEHSDCYSHTADNFVQNGYEVFAFDFRGHGRSEGQRGYTDSIQNFVSDLDSFIESKSDTKFWIESV